MNFEQQFAKLPEYIPEFRKDRKNNTKAGLRFQPSGVTQNDSTTFNTFSGEERLAQKVISSSKQGWKISNSSEKQESLVALQSNASLDALAEVAALEKNTIVSESEQSVDTIVHTPSRRTPDLRRSLVMQLFNEYNSYFPGDTEISMFQQQHSDIFPTKGVLLLKVREIRQKMLQNTSQNK